ncbi:IS110 family transposase [Amycolatopsis sp. AA4]|uniref:IS110 family transposase n=1 Tax=Actinomycetes TaxID=1760 RepID=UPI0001B54B8A|nr:MULTISPECIES: IS110 family transposase [Actinomycetes]ATY14020.1 IS110 family transposase [Amycolatopsis sp. AA4]EFL10049.1 IS901 protein [Streptomyces sp. AA4]
MAIRLEVWVGIDVGKSMHHACAIDTDGKVLFSQKLGNDQRAIEQLIARASAAAQRAQWAIDLTSPMALLLITALLAADQSVTYVPGRVVNTMTHGFRGEGKTDAKDARVIAETARLRRDLTEVTMPDELAVSLTQLTSYRADLMSDWVAGINRLRALLGSIFPALEAAFDYSNRTPLILVAGMCTPAEIRTAGIGGVTTHLTDNKAWGPAIGKTAATAVAAADAQDLVLPGEADAAMLVKRIARKLLDLDREIKDTDKLITARFRRHPWARIIESLPGMGPGLGAEFLASTGGDLASFATAGRLASYAGLVPVPRDSGRVSGNLRRPKRYNRRLRRVFYMAALSSLRTQGPSRRFYDKKRAERLIHTQALLALARRLVDVLWALLRDGREFTLDTPNPVTVAA